MTKKLVITIEETEEGSKVTAESAGYNHLEIMGLLQSVIFDIYKQQEEIKNEQGTTSVEKTSHK